MNSDYPSFKDAVRAFFSEAGITKPPVAACLAVAGPVSNNSVEFTNRKEWSIDGDDIASHFGIHHVRLINDFMAVGYGLLTLNEKTECVTLQVPATTPSLSTCLFLPSTIAILHVSICMFTLVLIAGICVMSLAERKQGAGAAHRMYRSRHWPG
jgi:glucokinase